ncbi:MAG: hypothetical protein ACR2I2_06410 [Bryobacteraceae bacterium]
MAEKRTLKNITKKTGNSKKEKKSAADLSGGRKSAGETMGQFEHDPKLGTGNYNSAGDAPRMTYPRRKDTK